MLTQIGAGGPVRSLADVRFKFHNSPKRYLGKQESFVGDVGGRPVMVTAQQVVQAAWMRLFPCQQRRRADRALIRAYECYIRLVDQR